MVRFLRRFQKLVSTYHTVDSVRNIGAVFFALDSKLGVSSRVFGLLRLFGCLLLAKDLACLDINILQFGGKSDQVVHVGKECVLFLDKCLEHLLLPIHLSSFNLLVTLLIGLTQGLFDLALHTQEGVLEDVDVLRHFFSKSIILNILKLRSLSLNQFVM